jgi:hypothetical protein
VVVHTACQAIEHHDDAKEAVALCAAAVLLIGAVRLFRPGGSNQPRVPLAWGRVAALVPVETVTSGRISAAWLQRFQN